MSGSFLYQWVLASPSGERMAAIRALNDVSLCRLAGWLRRDYDESGTTGEVLGLCLVEGYERLAREHGEREEEETGGTPMPPSGNGEEAL